MSVWLIFTVKTDLRCGWVQCATWPPGAAYTDLLSAVVVLEENKGTILTPAVLDVQVQNQSWQRCERSVRCGWDTSSWIPTGTGMVALLPTITVPVSV